MNSTDNRTSVALKR